MEHGGTAWYIQFASILIKPDNIPIVGILGLLFWFSYVGFKEARKNDELIAQGREDEVLRRMQE